MKRMNLLKSGALISFVLIFLFSNAQDPLRFENEIAQIRQIGTDFAEGRKVIVFTGSSSIRMWKNKLFRFKNVEKNDMNMDKKENDLLKRKKKVRFIQPKDNQYPPVKAGKKDQFFVEWQMFD